MASAGSLSAREIALAERLISAGLDQPQAVLAVAMCTRGHARPEREVVDLVRQYPGLSTPGVAEAALAALRRRGWVVEREVKDTMVLCSASPDLPVQSAEFVGDPAFAEAMRQSRSVNQPEVRILGHMHDPGVYETFGPRIRTATHEILLPMINTTPNLAQVADLQSVARSGVSVRVLLAAPKLAARIRGNVSLAESKGRIEGWVRNSDGYDNFEVRVTNRASDLWAASSMYLDGRLLRFDVFDPVSQRTTQGVMVEVVADGVTNLALIFKAMFDEAWQRSRRPGFTGALTAITRVIWLPVIAALAFGVALLLASPSSVPVAFTGGVLAGLISNYLPRVPEAVSRVVERLRR
ncbi:hypothetical protein [Saccharothrix sp. HUAS TT1]|uniref:hypothetical protein n=1 Tax=unclassified Saccharothrix TaxID=2593673 RepID=UPI00345B940E